jgi:hypothetical protein
MSTTTDKKTKILRLGFTECTLLAHYFYKKNNIYIKPNSLRSEFNLINWLYTTSGYYDKTVEGNYFNAKHKNNIYPNTYVSYMETVMRFINNSDIFGVALSKINIDSETLNIFLNSINSKDCFISKEIVYDFIKDKNILIISPFSSLIENQIVSGNCKKIYSNFPNINKIYTYNFIYTFFNEGPDQNILETCDNQFELIINNIENNYDSVVISCGAYSVLLAEKFYNKNKNVLTIGGDLQTYFGIANNRFKKEDHLGLYSKELNSGNLKYWITNIPDELKPNNFQFIENGCYW